MAESYITDVMGTGLIEPNTQPPVDTQTPTQAPVVSPVQPTAYNPATASVGDVKQRILDYRESQATGVPEIPATDIADGTGVTVPTQDMSPTKLEGTLAQEGAQAETALTAEAETPTTDTTGQITSDNIGQYMTSVYQEGQDFNIKDVKEEAGYYEAEEALKRHNVDYIAHQKETRDRIDEMRQNPEGKLVGALNADITNYSYKRNNELADLAIQGMYAQGRFDTANQIAQDAIDAENMMYNRKIDFLANMHTILQNDMTESESALFNSQLRMQETAVQNLHDAKTSALQAATANNAPSEVIQGIKNALTAEDVWATAGQYSIDPTLALAQDKFAWDKYVAQKNIDIATAAAQGKIDKETAEAGKVGLSMLKDANKTLQAVNEALNNKVGMGVSTGAVQSPMGYALGGAVTGAAVGAGAGPLGSLVGGVGGAVWGGINAENARDDFKSDIRLIQSAQTLSEFANLGFSLAPVSNSELALVGAKASQVASAVHIDETTGELTITQSGAEFSKNLDELGTQLEATILALLKDPAVIEAVTAADLESLRSTYESL